MRLLIHVALLFCVATAAFASNPDAAVKAHLQCVADNIAKLNDGKITVEELTNRIIPLCHAEHVAAMEATNGDPSNADLERAHTIAAIEMTLARPISH